ncbi:MAG: hypothetical protein ABJA78_08655 [Ferruginibacter sp.]
MKRLIIALVIAGGLFSTAEAQFRLSINIGTQPVWGPTGYDHADYYYLPDIDTYYSIPERVYIYRSGRSWKRSANLPDQYRDFDVYKAHKVVLNNVRNPYNNDKMYRRQYANYKGKYDQTPIRDSKEQRYFENKDHPRHSEWKQNNNNRDNDKNNHNRHHGKG